MTPLALTLLFLICSIFGTTSEPSYHGRGIIPDELYEGDIHGTNPKLAHLYDNYKDTNNSIINTEDDNRHPNKMRHYNINAKGKKEAVPEELYKAKPRGRQIPSNAYVNDKDANHVDVNVDVRRTTNMRQYNVNARSKRETNNDPHCQPFVYEPGKKRLTHPRNVANQIESGEVNYKSNTTCFTTIEADTGLVVELTFVDVFAIEDHPECKYDYLEIRDGKFGYSLPVYKFCGRHFPPTITSTGPYMWLKFKSDEIIEYAGFTIEISFPPKTAIRRTPDSCYKRVSGISGVIDPKNSDVQTCLDQTTSGPLDIQWRIETAPGTQIYLNISVFQLVDKNNCSANTVQIFGAEPNIDHLYGYYCSSVAKSLWTDEHKKVPGPANIMYIRFFTYDRRSNFTAIYTEFRSAESCEGDEFNCKDATCISDTLRCDGIAHCRLKADEDAVECKGEAQSLVRDKDTRTILIVFSLILSAMISVFLFKCIRKLYLDQKQINAHRAQLCDILNKTASQLTLGQKSHRLSRDRDTPSSREQNHENEMNRHMFQSKSSSMESDFLRVPVDDDWPESQPILEDVRLQYKGRPARDLSNREESLRGKGSKELKDMKLIRDLSVGTQEPKDSECQTRDSLFQTEPIVPKLNVPGSKSGTNSRPVCGVTSPTPGMSHLTVELLRQTTAPDSSSSQADGRPLSTESTKSAPDVIQIY